MPLQLACIADDITGASDFALVLASHGMSVSQVMGAPEPGLRIDSEAVVFALKSRTAPVEQAVKDSLVAAETARQLGARQLYFKYCSTFDSTSQGNIGPVTEALLEFTGESFTVVCPAFPANGRTVCDGRLLVNGVPLSESSMRFHPLTPMRESSLLVLMDQQTHSGATGLVSLNTVRQGCKAIQQQFQALESQGNRFAVVDCDNDADLIAIAEACRGMKLVTGASALAMGIPANFHPGERSNLKQAHAPLPATLGGQPVVLAGSCSETTREQVRYMARRHSAIRIDPFRLRQNKAYLQDIKCWAAAAWRAGPVLVYSSTNSTELQRAQQELGSSEAAKLVEYALGAVAADLADRGACKFIIAGGETSGAVAAALNIKLLLTGPRIVEGVPWMISPGDRPMALAFKSGNFGREDFFERAIDMLASEQAA